MGSNQRLFESVIILFLFCGGGVLWLYAYGMVYDSIMNEMAGNHMFELSSQWQFAYDYVYDIGDVGYLVGWALIATGIAAFFLNATRKTQTDTYATLDQGVYYGGDE
jgi:hypothetical protein